MNTVSTDQFVGQHVGQYVVKSLLGRGQLSAVYLVQHPEQATPAALTTFLVPERFSVETRLRFNQRFQREASAVAALIHPNVLPVLAYGEQYTFPYLITPYLTHGSLADILKQRGPCSLEYALKVLKQAASGLEYAHGKGIMHGTLKPSNILLTGDQHFLVAGFGLAHMLQMRGIEPNVQPYSYLLSVADTFLYASTSIAPEVVQGQPIDARTDIYALGIMLFELLHGAPPFSGTSPLDTALQHVQRPVPSLHALQPDIPIALELVINHALVPDPAQRFQHVSELVDAFEMVCRGNIASSHEAKSSIRATTPLAHDTQITQDVRSVLEEEVLVGGWQLTPPIVTGKFLTPRAAAKSGKTTARIAAVNPQSDTADGWQILPPIITGRVPAVRPSQQVPETSENVLPATLGSEEASKEEKQDVSTPSIVPMPPSENTGNADALNTPAWWIQAPSAVSTPSSSTPQTSEPSMKREQETAAVSEKLVGSEKPVELEKQAVTTDIRHYRPAKRSRNDVKRRKLIATLAAGSLVAVGAAVLGKLGLEHFETSSHTPIPQGTQSPQKNTQHTSTPTTKGTATSVKKTTPTSGQVLLSSPLGLNTSAAIVNPADGLAGLLIHLPNGNFVAYERACTHEGVPVNYDPVTHTLICPAHGAVFDPLNKAKVLQGPANQPLPSIAIRVNANGTITSA